jgi:flagellar P-ring protein precursor FlgI
LRNVLSRMGANLLPEQVQSRNVAAVLVTASLPAAANVGDRIDVTVSSIGDARSLAGGTLLMTPLLGSDQHSYALAQGPLIVGGHRFDADLNRQQRNYPTSGNVPGGATVETAVRAPLVDSRGFLTFILDDPDPETARRIAGSINLRFGRTAQVRDAAAVQILVTQTGLDPNGLSAEIGSIPVVPDDSARVVVNERTGTIVAGGEVRISSVVVSQGDVRVEVNSERYASEPQGYLPFDYEAPRGPTGLIVTNTRLHVEEGGRDAVRRFPAATVADLVEGLTQLRVDTRGIIAVLKEASMDRISEILLLKSLDGLSARAAATAQNIANASTDGYRPMRVDFEEMLARASPLGPAALRSVAPRLRQTEGGALRLDLEIADASKTAARYGALAELLGREAEIEALAVNGAK